MGKDNFQHDLAYSNENLWTKTYSEKGWKERVIQIAFNQHVDGYQTPVALMICKSF